MADDRPGAKPPEVGCVGLAQNQSVEQPELKPPRGMGRSGRADGADGKTTNGLEVSQPHHQPPMAGLPGRRIEPADQFVEEPVQLR